MWWHRHHLGLLPLMRGSSKNAVDPVDSEWSKPRIESACPGKFTVPKTMRSWYSTSNGRTNTGESIGVYRVSRGFVHDKITMLMSDPKAICALLSQGSSVSFNPAVHAMICLLTETLLSGWITSPSNIWNCASFRRLRGGRLDSVGIAGFVHDFGTLDGKIPFDALGSKHEARHYAIILELARTRAEKEGLKVVGEEIDHRTIK